MGFVKKLLVYIDGTEGSIIAAKYGMALAKLTEAEFHVLYVINTRALSELVNTKIFLKEEEEEYKKDIESDADKYLNFVRHLASEKGVDAKTSKTSGTINIEVKSYVKENNIDLLIVSELSISKIQSRRDELYNESDRVLRSVTCSVLILKNEERVLELYNQLT